MPRRFRPRKGDKADQATCPQGFSPLRQFRRKLYRPRNRPRALATPRRGASGRGDEQDIRAAHDTGEHAQERRPRSDRDVSDLRAQGRRERGRAARGYRRSRGWPLAPLRPVRRQEDRHAAGLAYGAEPREPLTPGLGKPRSRLWHGAESTVPFWQNKVEAPQGASCRHIQNVRERPITFARVRWGSAATASVSAVGIGGLFYQASQLLRWWAHKGSNLGPAD